MCLEYELSIDAFTSSGLSQNSLTGGATLASAGVAADGWSQSNNLSLGDGENMLL